MLNNYFESKEDITTVPSTEPLYGSEHMLPSMPDITFLVDGIQHLLSTLNVNKASGPDHLS